MIEAAGGYGKTVLGAELVGSWWSVGIDIQLDQPGTSANLLAARLRAAAAQSGFTDAAGAASAGSDATATADAIVNALAKERCTFVVDDAHHAAPDAAALIERIASRLEGEQHLVVLARELPTGSERLRRAEYFALNARDLALTPEEVLALCRSGFGLPTSTDGAKALTQLTGGWTAATVLAVARAARTGKPAEEVAASAISPENPADAVAAILQEPIAALGPEHRSSLAQVARLPLLDHEVVDEATGVPGFFDKALAAGVPFSPAGGTWWDLVGPVRDYMATFAPPSAGAMRRAADLYRSRGELGAALALLLASGNEPEAARVLAATTPEDAESMDGLELQAIFDQLPSEVVDANPKILLLVARGHGVAFEYGKRGRVLDRARQIAARTGDPVLARAVAAETVNDLCRQFAYQECIEAAREVLVAAAPEERLTRARCHYALARALWLSSYADRSHNEALLADADASFEQAVDLYRGLGMRSTLSAVLVDVAMTVLFSRGRAAAALATLDEALALVVDRPRRWAWVLCFHAKVAAELGLDEVCRDDVAEVLRIGERFDDDLLRSYGHQRLGLLSSYNGDADATLYEVRQAELHRTENWWAQASASFLAGAADWLDRVGHSALAWEYLGRAKEDPKNASQLVAMSEAALEARHGDPGLAEERLVAVVGQAIDRRELWRVSLLRAFAAYRRGDHGTAGALAARSFEEAARQGEPQLPMIAERAITEQLLALAVETGQPAALALQAATLPLSLALLGRFTVSAAGRPVPLAQSQEAKLLKFVAVNAGRVQAEQAIEALWPEAARSAGRNRLRVTVSRLRAAAGDILVRDGEMLKLAAPVRVDLEDFLREGRRAQTLAASDLALASAVARGAMAHYHGDLLPDDLYEDWADKPRQRARQVMLDLLDLCASEAAHRGDLDALRRVVERTIELDPYDDTRYLRAATTLLQQGRRGEALTVVKRARTALAELGLEPPRPLLDLERSIVA